MGRTKKLFLEKHEWIKLIYDSHIVAPFGRGSWLSISKYISIDDGKQP